MRSLVYRAADALAGWALPPRCVLCGSRGRLRQLDLCATCAEDLPRASRACSRCGLPDTAGLSPVAAQCESCAAEPPPYDRLFAPFNYGFPLDGLIQALKYQAAMRNARVLGTLLGHEIQRLEPHGDIDLLVPMPLHASRLVERGFNQSHEIALFTVDVLGREMSSGALRRVRATPSQVGLDRQARLQNVRGAFAADTRAVSGRRIALLDDVVTTGSTVAAAAQALLVAGASGVVVWALARATQR
jgi:ComF family protein